MIRLLRFDHIVLTVQDIEASCAFYEKVLDMEVLRYEQRGEVRVALRFGLCKINLHPADHAVSTRVARLPTAGSGDFCLIAETPVEEVAERLKACAVPIIAGPLERSGALGPIQSVYFRDPDGNLVEVSNLMDRSADAP